MKTYFVVSDIHGFCKELKSSLKKAGFRKTNKDHILIVCGDVFDRGPDPIGVYKFITSIPKSRRVLIKGNHEDLYFELLNKSLPERHDYSNKTVDTFCKIADISLDYLYGEDYIEVWKNIRETVQKHQITEWLSSDEWKNYYELGNFIFVHSFIPTCPTDEIDYEVYDYLEKPCDDWRNSSEEEWGVARWGCPWSKYKQGLFQLEEFKGKTLVCGHWHTSDFFYHLKHDCTYFDEIAPIYYSSGIIGLDGGVIYNYASREYIHPQNVMVIKEDGCYAYNEDTKSLAKLVEVESKRIIETVTVESEDEISE